MKKDDYNVEKTVSMTIIDSENVLSSYSRNDKPIIDDDVADFISDSVGEYHIKQKVSFVVYSDMTDEEKNTFASAVKNYYLQKNEKLKSTISWLLGRSFFFAFIGLMGLITMGIWGDRLSDIWNGFADSFSCVFIWGFVDQFFIERVDLKKEVKVNEKICSLDIKFDSLEK